MYNVGLISVISVMKCVETIFPQGKAAGAWSYTSTLPVCFHGVVLS